MKLTKFIILFLAILLANTASVHAITIDDFQGDQTVEGGEPPFPTSNAIAVPASVVDPLRSSAIGGTRKLIVVPLSGSAFVNTELSVGLDFLIHSQDTGASGRSYIRWDGDTSAGTFDKTGLGGVDLTQDAATALQLVVLNFDYPSSAPVTIHFYVYTNGGNYSKQSVVINSQISTSTIISFPFSAFTTESGTGADFTDVGALELQIDGSNPAIDLQLESVRTNGGCPLVPDNNLRVLDDCGVCGGDNSSCADCLGVPNGPAIAGTACDNNELGVCDGGTYNAACSCIRNTEPSTELCDGIDNNCDGSIDEAFPSLGFQCGIGSGPCRFTATYICDPSGSGVRCGDQTTLEQLSQECEDSKGCDGVPGSKLVLDLCNVCGGNNSSCKDCKGEINGTAVSDRCNVCEGDGNACLNCTETDQTSLLRRLDNGAKRQENVIKQITVNLRQHDHSEGTALLIKRSLRKAHRLQLRNWTLSWQLPVHSNVCTNTQFCAQVSTEPILNEYRANSDIIRKMGISLLRKLQATGISTKLVRTLNRHNTATYRDSMELADQVPLYDSACS